MDKLGKSFLDIFKVVVLTLVYTPLQVVFVALGYIFMWPLGQAFALSIGNSEFMLILLWGLCSFIAQSLFYFFVIYPSNKLNRYSYLASSILILILLYPRRPSFFGLEWIFISIFAISSLMTLLFAALLAILNHEEKWSKARSYFVCFFASTGIVSIIAYMVGIGF